MPKFVGRYKLEKQENVEALLAAMGVNIIIRKIASRLNGPMDLEIKESEGKWFLIVAAPMKHMEIGPFKFGGPFEEKTADGRDCISTITLEGEDTWVHQQVNIKEGGKDMVTVRKFLEGGIDVVTMCDGVTAKSNFVRIHE